MANCNTVLTNLPIVCKLDQAEIRRIGFVRYKDHTNAVNTITQSAAAVLANWQTKMNEYNFETNALQKMVVTPLLYGVESSQGESEKFEEFGYSKKTADGTYQIMFRLIDEHPEVIKSLKNMEKGDMAIWLFDDRTKAWGLNNGASNFDPIRLQNVDVKDAPLTGRNTASVVEVILTVRNPDDMNNIIGIQIASADIHDDTDFYSLNDAVGTVTSPAVTGFQIVIATSGANSRAVTGVEYDDVTLVDTSDSTTKTLASSDKWTESPAGTYVANEAVWLTAGKTYRPDIRFEGYDITVDVNVVVPS